MNVFWWIYYISASHIFEFLFQNPNFILSFFFPIYWLTSLNLRLRKNEKWKYILTGFLNVFLFYFKMQSGAIFLLRIFWLCDSLYLSPFILTSSFPIPLSNSKRTIKCDPYDSTALFYFLYDWCTCVSRNLSC